MQPDNQREYDHIEKELRTQDPLSTIEHGLRHEVVADLRHDTQRIDDILATDETLNRHEKSELYEMGVNLRLDWLYAADGGRNAPLSVFQKEANETEEFINQAKHHAAEKFKNNPTVMWDLQTKWLDLETYHAHRLLKASQTTLKDTQAEGKVRELANLRMERVMRSSAVMMRDMQRYMKGVGSLAQDTRGMLYEHMLTTYARYQTYDAENFDEVFVRTALSREDRPWNKHAYPKRAFDIVIETKEGTRLLQAKNHDNDDEYADPIEKVKDTSFGHTMNDMDSFIKDFNILVMNTGDIKMRERTQQAGRHLDAVFGAQLAAAN